MNVTLVINGQDFAPVLSTYNTFNTVEYDEEVTTIKKKKVRFGEKYRAAIEFSLFPAAYGDKQDIRALMKRPMIVKFSDLDFGTVRQMEFLPDSDLSAKYLLHSVDGRDRYARKPIRLVAVEVNNASNIENVY